jgi:hypothetical protein
LNPKLEKNKKKIFGPEWQAKKYKKKGVNSSSGRFIPRSFARDYNQ